MCNYCRSLFVILSFFIWPLRCLSFFDLQILWYLQTLLLTLFTNTTDIDIHEFKLLHSIRFIYIYYYNVILPISHLSPSQPFSHPLKQDPFTLSQRSRDLQWPQLLSHRYPYVRFVHSKMM